MFFLIFSRYTHCTLMNTGAAIESGHFTREYQHDLRILELSLTLNVRTLSCVTHIIS